MNNPYTILGLNENASEEEVKKAYKTLAKKYHPDVCGNDADAQKKMQEINAAYDAIINHKDYSSSGSTGYRNPYSDFYGYNSQNTGDASSSHMRAAEAYINARHFREALNVLSSIKTEERDARWYYYSSVCSYYLGDSTRAYNDISEAIRREPGNMQYKAFLDRMRYGRDTYRERQGTYPESGGFLSCCLPLVLLNLFCPGYFCIC